MAATIDHGESAHRLPSRGPVEVTRRRHDRAESGCHDVVVLDSIRQCGRSQNQIQSPDHPARLAAIDPVAAIETTSPGSTLTPTRGEPPADGRGQWAGWPNRIASVGRSRIRT